MLFPSSIREFLQTPKVYFLGTRNGDFLCEIIRVIGLSISSPDSLCVYVYEGTAQKTVENLRSNKIVTLSATNPEHHESYQFKGRMLEIRAVTEEEAEFIKNYRTYFDIVAEYAGMPPNTATNFLPISPALCIEFEIEQIFDQTPKIGTGKLLTAV